MTKTTQDLVIAAKALIHEVTAEQAQRLLTDGALALDVREHAEFDAGHITEAHHIPRGLLEFMVDQHPAFTDKNQTIVVYCKTGGRSALATAVLQELGFADVCSLEGGYDNWNQTFN